MSDLIVYYRPKGRSGLIDSWIKNRIYTSCLGAFLTSGCFTGYFKYSPNHHNTGNTSSQLEAAVKVHVHWGSIHRREESGGVSSFSGRPAS